MPSETRNWQLTMRLLHGAGCIRYTHLRLGGVGSWLCSSDSRQDAAQQRHSMTHLLGHPSALARPRVLITGDDSIHAPGLRELVKCLSAAQICDVFVCAPVDERSAQSHAITLSPCMSGICCDVPGAVEGFAVHGTPADCVMLAMCAPVFTSQSKRPFDLVVSGINRGDNCGLHVLYSGTIGAAREAAARGVPAMALSLDHQHAHRLDDYSWAAHVGVQLIKATLQQLQKSRAAAEQLQLGCVLNVNLPPGACSSWSGIALTHQGSGYMALQYKEVAEAACHDIDVAEDTGIPAGSRMRTFRAAARVIHREDAAGSDNHALRRRWASVTPLWLKSDMPLCEDPAVAAAAEVTSVVAEIVEAAAAASNLPVMGVQRAAIMQPTTAAADGVPAVAVVAAAVPSTTSDMSDDTVLDADSNSSSAILSSFPLELQPLSGLGHLVTAA